MDFYQICTREIEQGPRKGEVELYPDFVVGRSKDLMIRGKSFYAIWDEAKGLWSTDEYDVQRLVDAELKARAERDLVDIGIAYKVKYLRSASNGGWYQFRKYMQNISDNSVDLDSNLTFANTPVKKEDHVSKRLPYSLEPGPTPAWDELVGTFYSVDERAKIEYFIGAIVAGDARKIQKFVVFYGAPGTGKGTVMDIILKLFKGYTTTFDAKALGSNNHQFATEAFKGNPLVAVQHDTDLSKIEDNARLNSVVSHEEMAMNEKYKPGYSAAIRSFCFIGTNKPVKISDAKSGIIRRLVDVHPTGVKIPINHYHTLVSQVDFELGAIAHKCLEVYRSMGLNYYEGYRPLEMMLQTDVFFNFIEAYYDVFKEQDSASLKQAYTLYKEYCSETGIEYVLPQYKFRTELRNYFDDFKDRVVIDGVTVRSYFTGFNANKFKAPAQDVNVFSLVMEETVSLLDDLLADQPAQYGKLDEDGQEVPAWKWKNVRTRLSDLDTSALHYLRVPKNHIVIDFDLKGVDGQKSLDRNLEAASVWPATYAELSKGGSGVHLHYLYDGDVEELASLYSEGIEVKTFLGNASLRRKLTKCNNVPVATLSNSLPLKEKNKMLPAQTIQSEKGLRDLIGRNLRKEIMPGTKPSVDFIRKILDDAYESGMTYDVTDLRPKIVAFANNSTNQPLVSLKIVQQMKFVGNGAVEAGFQKPADERLVFFDVEVYPNLFVVCWKYAGDANIVRMINPSAQEIEALLKMKLVGFYNRRYDNHILYGAYMGYTVDRLYKLSQDIIANDTSAMFGEAYGLSYADVWDYSSIKQTLKKWEIDLGIHHQEMDIPWDQPVPEDRIMDVVDYCCNDVLATEATHEARKQDFIARQILAELSGLQVNDTTAKHTAKIIFNGDRDAQKQFNYTDLSKEFPGYTYEMVKAGNGFTNVSSYRGENPSEGGYVYAEPGMYNNVAVLDVASMHPTTIEQLNLFGPYTKNFSALKSARMAIKHKDYASAKKMLGGKLAPYLGDEKQAKDLSYALKIVINIVYGLTAAKFDNPFRDIRNVDNIVAKRGALFMIDLKQACQEKGLRVAHIKTDSIKIPEATPEDIEEIVNFGQKYSYDFEHEATYEKFCLVNDAVYIAKVGWALDEEKIGTWEAVGAQFQHPVVYKTLFSKEEITFNDYCEARSVVQGAMYLDFEHDRPMALVEGMQHIGKTGLFVPVTSKCGGAVLYRVKDGKTFAVTGTKGHLWVEAEMAKAMGDKLEIDMSYFQNLINDAIKTIEKFGDFESFVN